MTEGKHTPDGGLAFPGSRMEPTGLGARYTANKVDYPGMTLRDYFAAHAPQHPVDFESPQQMLDFLGRKNVTPGGMEGRAQDSAAVQAKLAYIYADAMLAARSK